jgi:exopolyphosphatase/guanosine-5'-triphosphate,3'-diphosphate pyrophosphatase
MPRGSGRAVGTSALRMARDARRFLARAEDVLGHPIEIISGAEEARLIYLGVAHDLSDDQNRRLVVDIGGGSTECVLGERFEALKTDSLHMGCVNWSLRFFARGEITRDALKRARIAARLELQSMERHYRALGWQECVGSSGTIVAIDAILRENGWSERGIDAEGLRKLRKALVAAGSTEKLALAGLQAERAPVLPGGVAILSAVFDALGIESMRASLGALREGVLHDLLGRIRHEDLRDQTIGRFRSRYHVDLVQSGRVQRTALALLAEVEKGWDLPHENARQFLAWAASLHEIGLSVSHNGYHKHGAYLVEHSDMPGFSREDQTMLAALIEGHRRKLALERFDALPASTQRVALRLCARKNGYELEASTRWLDENPLSRADLEAEAERLAPHGIEITIR